LYPFSPLHIIGRGRREEKALSSKEERGTERTPFFRITSLKAVLFLWL
jgi:hypothetical protein